MGENGEGVNHGGREYTGERRNDVGVERGNGRDVNTVGRLLERKMGRKKNWKNIYFNTI